MFNWISIVDDGVVDAIGHRVLSPEVGITDSGKGYQCIQGSTDMGSFMGSNEQFKAHWRCHNSLSVCQSARYQYFTPILAIL